MRRPACLVSPNIEEEILEEHDPHPDTLAEILADVEVLILRARSLDPADARQVYDALSRAQTIVGQRAVRGLIREVGDAMQVKH